MRTIFHIDVNSAYLSWTSVENLKTGNGPDLREIPAIIGGDQKTRHGVVLAKSIPAKKFGHPHRRTCRECLKKMPKSCNGTAQPRPLSCVQPPHDGLSAQPDS